VLLQSSCMTSSSTNTTAAAAAPPPPARHPGTEAVVTDALYCAHALQLASNVDKHYCVFYYVQSRSPRIIAPRPDTTRFLLICAAPAARHAACQPLTRRMLLSLNVAMSRPCPAGVREVRGQLGCIQGCAACRSLKIFTCRTPHVTQFAHVNYDCCFVHTYICKIAMPKDQRGPYKSTGKATHSCGSSHC
jgi:hypothetical protein